MHPIDVSKAKRLIPAELQVGLGNAKSAPHGGAASIRIEGLCDAEGRPFQTFGTLMSRGFSNLYVSLLVPADERSTGDDIVSIHDMMCGNVKHRRMLVVLTDFIGVLYGMSGAAKNAAGAAGGGKPAAGGAAAGEAPDSEVARLRRDNLRLRTDIETSRRLLGRLLEELAAGAPVQEAQPASQLLTLALLSRLLAGKEK